MLSKIRTAYRLSGQLWIKDLPDRSRICVLELDGAVFSSVGFLKPNLLPDALGLLNYRAGSRLFLAASARLSIMLESSLDFRGPLRSGVTFCANFSRLSEFRRRVKRKSNLSTISVRFSTPVHILTMLGTTQFATAHNGK
jgi:hypothetical protein